MLLLIWPGGGVTSRMRPPTILLFRYYYDDQIQDEMDRTYSMIGRDQKSRKILFGNPEGKRKNNRNIDR
jgi:hypothetical protein